jgi:hypothetical protein
VGFHSLFRFRSAFVNSQILVRTLPSTTAAWIVQQKDHHIYLASREDTCVRFWWSFAVSVHIPSPFLLLHVSSVGRVIDQYNPRCLESNTVSYWEGQFGQRLMFVDITNSSHRTPAAPVLVLVPHFATDINNGAAVYIVHIISPISVCSRKIS